jgi:lipoprotein-anchoring transpeptidase ErfK/SrfK
MKRFFTVALVAILTGTAAYSLTSRPPESNVHFSEGDFTEKPWLREFQWVIVVNRANSGALKQSIRVYHGQTLVQFDEIAQYLQALQQTQDIANINDPNRKDRLDRIAELGRKMWAPGIFKVSTGRNAFESKGEHHSQHDSWSVTPTGFFVPQAFIAKHKSESYSSKACDSFAGKILGAILRKQLCTYMENVTFFNGGIGLHKAIPGTEPLLGTKASGGCVRLPAALAEFLFLNLQEAKGLPVPVVHQDGTVATDASGNVLRETSHRGEWGTLDAHSALIIVEDETEVGGADFVAPSAPVVAAPVTAPVAAVPVAPVGSAPVPSSGHSITASNELNLNTEFQLAASSL